ncbi:MAG: EamA family transporter [Holophaga sp.]|nr:EamA family transporter [Holophaga sp.]
MIAWLAYAICALVWGSTYFGIALGIESFTPFGMVATRYLSAGFLALMLSRLTKEPLPLKRDLPHLMFQGLLLLGISNALVTWAEGRVPSGLTAVLCSTTPFFYALMNREGLTLRGLAGLAIGFSGVAVLTWKPGQGLAMSPWGFGAIILATFLWAFGTLYARKHVQGRSLLGNVSVQMLTGGIFGLAMTPFTGGFLHAPLTQKALLAVLFLTIFGSLITQTAFNYLSRVWPPAKMSTYAFLNPVVAVLLGSLFLREAFTLRVAVGMLVILAGVALVQFPVRRPVEPLPAEE